MSRYFPLWSLALLGLFLISDLDRALMEWLLWGSVTVFLTQSLVREFLPERLAWQRKWIERVLDGLGWVLRALLAIQLIQPLLQFMRDPDWLGIAAPAAILIPVATIFVVTGGWASFRAKYIKSTKEN